MEYRHTRTHAGTYGQHKNYHDARTWRSTVHVETRMVQARAGAEGWGEGPFESPTFPPQREAPDPSAVISREGQPSGSDRPQTAATRVLIQAPSPTSRCQIPGCIQFLNYPKHSFELSLYKWNTYNINNNSGNYYPLRRGEGRGREYCFASNTQNRSEFWSRAPGPLGGPRPAGRCWSRPLCILAVHFQCLPKARSFLDEIDGK